MRLFSSLPSYRIPNLFATLCVPDIQATITTEWEREWFLFEFFLVFFFSFFSFLCTPPPFYSSCICSAHSVVGTDAEYTLHGRWKKGSTRVWVSQQVCMKKWEERQRISHRSVCIWPCNGWIIHKCFISMDSVIVVLYMVLNLLSFHLTGFAFFSSAPPYPHFTLLHSSLPSTAGVFVLWWWQKKEEKRTKTKIK